MESLMENTVDQQATAPASPAKDAPAAASPQLSEEEKKLVREVEELIRTFLVTEKNFNLYPTYGRVVQGSLDKLFKSFEEFFSKDDCLVFQVNSNELRYRDQPVYVEEDRRKSLSFRLYKDGIRDLVFLSDLQRDELEAFLSCIKEARTLEDDEADFVTLFWEKDCAGIQIHLADDYITKEDLPEMTGGAELRQEDHRYRFRIPPEEKQRLSKILESRRADDGDSTFELSEAELEGLRSLVAQEANYFAIFDFVDILQELMVRSPESEVVSRSVKMIRTLISSLVAELDFEHAAQLMRKLYEEAHPSLKEGSKRHLKEMLASVADKQTLIVLETFLKENPKLPKGHGVFKLLRAFPPSAADDFCAFLSIQPHLQSIVEVLVQLGEGRPEVFAKHLEDPDPTVACAMVDIILRTDKEAPLRTIEKAIRHPVETVRLHVAKALVEHGDESVSQAFVPLLQESSCQLLNLALQFFIRHTVSDAYESLEGLTRSRSFYSLDPRRQQLCFKALLKASPEGGLHFIRNRVLKWRFSLSKAERQRKSSALLALALHESPAAEEALDRFARLKRSPLSSVAQRALKERQAANRARIAKALPVDQEREQCPTEVQGV